MSADIPQDSSPETGARSEAATPATPNTDPAAQLAAVTAERDKYKDGLLRALADADNIRKRARRDADENVRKAREELMRELLPVFDNLERALKYVDLATDPKAVVKGLEMVVRLFDDTLVRLGGVRVKTVGESFDPQQHEAVQQMPSEQYAAGTIMAEALAGYVFNDRLLRPAMVIVSQGPASSAIDGGAATDGKAGGAGPDDDAI